MKNVADGKFNNPFTALKHKNFRYYWIGMCISLIGTWMQNMAQPWLAYSLTKSPLLLSLVGTLQFLPLLLFSLFAGAMVDKYPKKRILLFTQSASMVITFTLGILVWTDLIRYWHILVLALCLGMVNTLDMPARQSFVIEMVGKEDLMNAIALNSSVFNLARVFGPALAGIVMGYLGIAWCFFINSLSFAAVLISIFFIHPLVINKKPSDDAKILEEIKDGLKYIYLHRNLASIFVIVGVIGVFAMNFSVLVPVFATEVLKQQEVGFGFLLSCIGAGAFIAAMLVASMSKSGPQKHVIIVVPLLIAVSLIMTSISTSYMATAFCLVVTGFFFVYFSSIANSTLQLNVSDEYRGRIMSVYALVFAGSTPIGNLYAGFFTEHFGARIGFAVCGGAILLLLIPLYSSRYFRSRLRYNETSPTE